MREKTCKKCGKTKKIKQFTKNPDGAGGFRNYCKVCEGLKKLRPHKKVESKSMFFSSKIFEFMKYHRFKEVAKFGIFYGVLVFLDKKDILAFSVAEYAGKKTRTFEYEQEARAWLYKKMVEAGERTVAGLKKYSRRIYR